MWVLCLDSRHSQAEEAVKAECNWSLAKIYAQMWKISGEFRWALWGQVMQVSSSLALCKATPTPTFKWPSRIGIQPGGFETLLVYQ